jgi:hypothetical protein
VGGGSTAGRRRRGARRVVAAGGEEERGVGAALQLDLGAAGRSEYRSGGGHGAAAENGSGGA